MLRILVPGDEYWDDIKEEFITKGKDTILQLEHSLVSISKWEAKWEKAYLSKKQNTLEEFLDYIKCMTITQNVPEEVYSRLTRDNMKDIQNYINSRRSATYLTERKTTGGSREVVTSELIYYWMIELGIPSGYDKWHLNRLLTLIRVCRIKKGNTPKKNKRDIMQDNMRLNQERRKMYGSKG